MASITPIQGTDVIANSRAVINTNFDNLNNAVVQKTYATVGFAAGCDYVCDGVADDVQIQAAITAAIAAGGGIVLLKSGTYDITATINIVGSKISLIGEGPSTYLKLANAANLNVIKMGNGTTTYQDNLIARLQIDGNKGNQTTGTLIGIYVSKCNYCVLDSVWIINAKTYGIYLGDSTHYCRVVNSKTVTEDFDGIVINFSNYNIVMGNACQGASHGGIYDKGSIGTIIMGNNCDANSTGIVLLSCSKTICHGNYCSDNVGGSGIGCQDVSEMTITGNVCFNNSFAGIRGDGIKWSTIANNVCNNNGVNLTTARVGIFITKVSGAFDPVGNTITGNQCGNVTGTTQQYGIQCNTTSDYILVANNRCFSNSVANVDMGSGANNIYSAANNLLA